MAIDNFDIIKPMLEWRSDDDFYFIQILQRKKDHKQSMVNGTNNNSRLVKAYYVKSLDSFEFYKPEIIELCKLFNARAGINLNRRSFKKMALQTLKHVTDQLLNEAYDKVYKVYPTVVGKFSNESDKMWILDVDNQKEPNRQTNEMILFAENECMPKGKKFVNIIPSKNGFHIIVNPFNLDVFKKRYPEVEVHKNNPTNLYIP